MSGFIKLAKITFAESWQSDGSMGRKLGQAIPSFTRNESFNIFVGSVPSVNFMSFPVTCFIFLPWTSLYAAIICLGIYSSSSSSELASDP